MENEFELDFIGFPEWGSKRTVWLKESFEEHAKYRPGLREKDFQDRIKKAVQEPDLIIESHQNNNLCFYYREYRSVDRNGVQVERYTKVIITIEGNTHYIRSAFRPDRIKELDYNKKPLWIK